MVFDIVYIFWVVRNTIILMHSGIFKRQPCLYNINLVITEKQRLQKIRKVRNWVFHQLANNVYISASCHLCMLVNDEYRVSYWICWLTSGTLIQNIHVQKLQTEKCANTAIILLEIPISYHIHIDGAIRCRNVLSQFILYSFFD